MEIEDVKKYLIDNLSIQLRYNEATETINAEILLGDDLICDSSMPLPKPKVSWT